MLGFGGRGGVGVGDDQGAVSPLPPVKTGEKLLPGKKVTMILRTITLRTKWL